MKIGTTLKHFRITAELGAGGMGEVYRAEDTNLGREVAIKILPDDLATDPGRIARFEREARALASVVDPGIAAVHEIGEADGARFIVMELVPGETLAERLARGPLPVTEALELAVGTAQALQTAHAAGIVHRDLKPANLKPTADGGIKVLDFGLARILAGEDEPAPERAAETATREADLTGTGLIVGTAAYMSPEQVRGADVDARTDIWALGCVLFEMLSGRRPFAGATPQECLAAILAEEPRWDELPADLPPAVARVLRRCLRKDPAERFHHVADVRIALQDAGEAGAAASPPAGAADPSARRRPRRRRLLAIAIPLAAVLAGLGLGLALRGGEATSGPSVHAAIAPPAGTSFELHPVFPGPVAVSADGASLVFAAKAPGEPARLWVRRLAEAEAAPLAGTEGATYPFWSPDGRSVAYVVDGRLERIAVAGGPPISLTDTRMSNGGAWSAGDVILAAAADGSIHRVPAGGGESRPVTTVDREAGEVRHVHPRFLPDGDHFLFLAFHREIRDGGSQPVMLASLSGEPPREVMRSVSLVEYGDGHLWYLRDGVLMARPFDPERGELTGPAIPVGEGAIESAWAAAIGGGYFSVSGAGVIAYHARGTATRESRLAWYGRDGTLLGEIGRPRHQYHVSLSPDGSRAILQVESPDVRGWDLWAYDLGPGRLSRVTFRPNSAVPVWAPDGERIAFDSDRSGDLEIYLKTLGRDDAAPLMPDGISAYGGEALAEGARVRGAFPLDWSPDGRRLVYCTMYEGRRPDLWVVDLEQRDRPLPLQQSPFSEEDAAISPDGRWLAYTSDASERYEIYVTRFPRGGRARQVSIDGGIRPEWNPQGGELFFLSPDYNLMSVPLSEQGDDLVPGPVEPLFRVQGRYHVLAEPGVYAVAPGGDRFLINRLVEPDSPSLINLIVGWPRRLSRQDGSGG